MNEKRLVLSGTYSVGKTTTATALSLATGIPMIQALSAREILLDLYPNRRFQDMQAEELMALGLKRMEERLVAETRLFETGGSFISDGSVLNEWIYGTVRLKIGINPGADWLHQVAKAFLGIPGRGFFKKYLAAYGTVANLHAKKWYTEVVHLPVEFPMDPDGHRPVSEKYRQISDSELQVAFQKLEIPLVRIGGDQQTRLRKIIDHHGLNQVLELDTALAQARAMIEQNRESVAQRMIEQIKEPSLVEKVKFMTKF